MNKILPTIADMPQEDRELCDDCQAYMADYYPDAQQLFWAFQEKIDEENAKILLCHLRNKGIKLSLVGFD